MSEDAELEAAFNADLIARVRALREARGWTQSKMAAYLGIPIDRYKKYESRSPLPQYLIPRFADFVGRDIEYVLTGRAPRR
jgi:transcriptional regulator with XRE-family HTH domain